MYLSLSLYIYIYIYTSEDGVARTTLHIMDVNET